jgi:choline dehydrogenase-like flavoprotein
MRRYDVVAVGSGFATTFWILEYLRHAPAAARVLVLERGPAVDPAWRLENRSNSPIRPSDTYRAAGPVAKPWIFTIGLGGGANCWAGCAPRFLPSDFRMRSLYGVGRDWPIGYDDLEPFYTQAEAIMALSGSAEDAPWPMSRPYPQPPHRMSDPDLMMRRKHGRLWIPQPTARARVATETRAACCENSVCEVCPLDAKFMIRNDLPGLWADQRVEFRTDAKALEVEVGAGLARSVLYREGGEEKRVAADIVVLGANAIFNAHLLQASGLGGLRNGAPSTAGRPCRSPRRS